MYKQILSFLVIIALSAAIVLFMPQAKVVIDALVSAHNYVSGLLTDVFSAGHAGNIARGLLALITIPLLAGLLPSLVYFLIRKHWFPYFLEIVWFVWLLQVGALIASSAIPAVTA